MSRIEELRAFARQQESFVREKLIKIRVDVLKEQKTCVAVKNQYKVILSEKESNDEDQDLQELASNLNDIVEFYETQLSNIDEATKKINLILPFDFNKVELDEKISTEEYERQISNGYDSVIRNFKQASEAIIKFCKILVDIADKNRTEQRGDFGKMYILVNILVKFILPLQTICKVLTECLEKINDRDSIAPNSNDSHFREEACEQLKLYAYILIDKDNKIKISLSQLLEPIIDWIEMNDDFRNDFYTLMREYYRLNRKHGIIHLELCAYKMHTDNEVTASQIQNYLKDVKGLKDSLQNYFKGAIQLIPHA